MIFLLKKFREMVLQLLFSIDRGGSIEEDLIPFFKRELAISQKHVRCAYKKARAIWEMREILDQKISEISSHWKMDCLEKNILRLALYEMLIEKEVAPKIVITEAIRLCRKFSTPKVGTFVNAILDAYYPEENNELESTLSSSERNTAQ